MPSIEADIYIHAAPAAVYRRFTHIAEWPSWYPGVLDAQWRSGHAWDEGAEIAVRVRNVLGMSTEGVAIVRMSVPNSRLVWETMLAGASIVATAHFQDEVGGCKLTIRKNYHGPATMLLPILRGRQEGQLRRGLAELKRKIEGQPRG